jgi:hypothetical protein
VAETSNIPLLIQNNGFATTASLVDSKQIRLGHGWPSVYSNDPETSGGIWRANLAGSLEELKNGRKRTSKENVPGAIT